MADSWFDNIPIATVHLLRTQRLFAVMVKLGKKVLPKDLLLQRVTENGVFVRDKRAYVVVGIDVNGCSKRFQLAAHVDK
jgi:hypothetical protein